MTNKKFAPYLAIITAVTFWGISYISTDICLGYMQPITLAALRSVTASIILFVVWKNKEPNTKIKKEHLLRFFLSGFFGIACYSVAEFYGVKFTSPAVAAIILASIPIFSLLSERIAGKKKLTFIKIIGVIISLIGVMMVMGIGFNELDEGGKAIGYLFMLGAALSWVVFNYISMPLYEEYTPLTITTFQLVFASVILALVFAVTGEPIPSINLTVAVNILFLAGLCSAAGFTLYMYAMRSLGILTTTLFINIQPLVTVVASMVILKEFLSFNQLLGGILVIGAVYLSTYRKRNLHVAEEKLDGQ